MASIYSYVASHDRSLGIFYFAFRLAMVLDNLSVRLRGEAMPIRSRCLCHSGLKVERSANTIALVCLFPSLDLLGTTIPVSRVFIMAKSEWNKKT
jgi:hypothetical protein